MYVHVKSGKHVYSCHMFTYEIMSIVAEEAILNEERTTDEEKMKIIEGMYAPLTFNPFPLLQVS